VCGFDGFECNDGTCIPASFVCDGFDDCAGGEDEVGC
jgi:low density lipoprotein-related protein 2